MIYSMNFIGQLCSLEVTLDERDREVAKAKRTVPPERLHLKQYALMNYSILKIIH